MELDAKQLRVLMFSTDAKILENKSAVRQRMIDYGAEIKELHITLLCPGKSSAAIKISDNVFVHQTVASTNLLSRINAVSLGSQIVKQYRLTPSDSIVTTQDPFEVGWVADFVARKHGLNLHVQIHTDLYSPYFATSMKSRFRLWLAKRVLNKASAIRVVSERIKESLSPKQQAKTKILPIFADLQSISTAPITVDLKQKFPQFEQIFLIASRLTEEKDIEDAITAFNALDREDAGLIIVGSGPEKSKLEKEVAKLNLQDQVIFLPWTDQATLFSYYRTCDTFISTSRFEGYGLSMLEAWAANAKIVATDAGIAPELTQFICRPGDTGCLNEKMFYALSGKTGRRDYISLYSSKDEYLQTYVADWLRALNN